MVKVTTVPNVQDTYSDVFFYTLLNANWWGTLLLSKFNPKMHLRKYKHLVRRYISVNTINSKFSGWYGDASPDAFIYYTRVIPSLFLLHILKSTKKPFELSHPFKLLIHSSFYNWSSFSFIQASTSGIEIGSINWHVLTFVSRVRVAVAFLQL